MSHFNSINQRSKFGNPPPHYKNSRKGMLPPDLNLLKSGQKDNILRFQSWGNDSGNFRIPIKWSNPFLPWD